MESMLCHAAAWTSECSTHVRGSEDGQLQQCGREALTQSEDEGGLLAEQLLHGGLQSHVQAAVTLHKVWQAAARLQELLHLRGGAKDIKVQMMAPEVILLGHPDENAVGTWPCTTPCQQRAMPAMLLLLFFTLGLAAEVEEEESLFLVSLPSGRHQQVISS